MQTTFKERLRDFIREQRRSIRKFGTMTSPLPCLIFSQSDISIERRETYIKFIDRFSVQFGKGPTVNDPLDYHPCRARPALRLSETQIFAPLIPMLCEQLYESPFYKIVDDKTYFLTNANNRGMAAELMLSEVLAKVQHLNLARDVKLSKAGKEIGQIDVAAVFGPTAIIFEIKTKRLTQASKNGSTKNLIIDIQAGILEAQQQLSNIKASLLSKTYDSISCKTGDIDALSQASQIICISVMTHEIPAYPLFIRTILENARVADIVPITIFDLKIATAYLNNAFDFIYYFATRSILDSHLMYGTETALLAFHLKNRLTIPDHVHQVLIDDSIGQNIDADYPNREKKLSLKFGVRIVDEIAEEIIRTGDASLFRLFSVLRGMSGGSAKDASVFLRKIEKMLRRDGKAHDVTMAFGDVALTFIVANDPSAARSRLDALIQKRDRDNNDFTQQYMLVLSPGVRRPSGVSQSKNGANHFDVRAIAMKQSKSSNNGILAFSPRIPEGHWQVREEDD